MNENICQFCLSVDRQLSPVKKQKNLLLKLKIWKELNKKGDLCWECKYLLKKFFKFKNRTEQAQHHLLYVTQCPSFKLKSLSSLSVAAKDAYDFEFYYLSEEENEPIIKKEVVINNDDDDIDDIVPEISDSIQGLLQNAFADLHQGNNMEEPKKDQPRVRKSSRQTKLPNSEFRNTDIEVDDTDTADDISDWDDSSSDWDPSESTASNGLNRRNIKNILLSPKNTNDKPKTYNVTKTSVKINDIEYTTNDVHQEKNNINDINLCSETVTDEHKRESRDDVKHKKQLISHTTWNTKEMVKAIEVVQNKELGYFEASKQYNVPRALLMKLCSMKHLTPAVAVTNELLRIIKPSDKIESNNQQKMHTTTEQILIDKNNGPILFNPKVADVLQDILDTSQKELKASPEGNEKERMLIRANISDNTIISNDSEIKCKNETSVTETIRQEVFAINSDNEAGVIETDSNESWDNSSINCKPNDPTDSKSCNTNNILENSNAKLATCNIIESSVKNNMKDIVNDVHQTKRLMSNVKPNLCSEEVFDEHKKQRKDEDKKIDDRITWIPKEMVKAIESVQEKKLGFFEASKKYNVPRGILMKLSSMRHLTPATAVTNELYERLKLTSKASSNNHKIIHNTSGNNLMNKNNVSVNTQVKVSFSENQTQEFSSERSHSNEEALHNTKLPHETENVTPFAVSPKLTEDCNSVQFEAEGKGDNLAEDVNRKLDVSGEQINVTYGQISHVNVTSHNSIQEKPKLMDNVNRCNNYNPHRISRYAKQFASQDLIKNVYPLMPLDLFSIVAQDDQLICAFGNCMLNLQSKKKAFPAIANKMRKLAEVLVKLRLGNSRISNLLGTISPKFYKDIIAMILKVCKNIPSKILSLCSTLLKCARIALNEIINPNHIEIVQDVKAFVKLVHNFVNNYSSNDLNITKSNGNDKEKPTNKSVSAVSGLNRYADTITKQIRIILEKCDNDISTPEVRLQHKFWTENDILILNDYFSENFKCKMCPTKTEILRFLEKYDNISKYKTWLQIYCKISKMIRSTNNSVSQGSLEKCNMPSNEIATSKEISCSNFDENIPLKRYIQQNKIESDIMNPEISNAKLEQTVDVNTTKNITMQNSNSVMNSDTVYKTLTRKYKYRMWTEEALNAIRTHFASHFENKTTPKTREIESFVNNFPELCGGRKSTAVLSKVWYMIHKDKHILNQSSKLSLTEENYSAQDKMSDIKAASQQNANSHSDIDQSKLPILEESKHHYTRRKRRLDHKINKNDSHHYVDELMHRSSRSNKCLKLNNGEKKLTSISVNNKLRTSNSKYVYTSNSETDFKLETKQSKRRNYTNWTNEASSTLKQHFANYFESKTIPKRDEVLRFMNKFPELCKGRNVASVTCKVFYMINRNLNTNPVGPKHRIQSLTTNDTITGSILNNNTNQSHVQLSAIHSESSSRRKRRAMGTIQKGYYRKVAGKNNIWSPEEISTLRNYFLKHLNTKIIPNTRDIQTFIKKHSKVLSRKTTNQILYKYMHILRRHTKNNINIINSADVEANDMSSNRITTIDVPEIENSNCDPYPENSNNSSIATDLLTPVKFEVYFESDACAKSNDTLLNETSRLNDLDTKPPHSDSDPVIANGSMAPNLLIDIKIEEVVPNIESPNLHSDKLHDLKNSLSTSLDELVKGPTESGDSSVNNVKSDPKNYDTNPDCSINAVCVEYEDIVGSTVS